MKPPFPPAPPKPEPPRGSRDFEDRGGCAFWLGLLFTVAVVWLALVLVLRPFRPF